MPIYISYLRTDSSISPAPRPYRGRSLPESSPSQLRHSISNTVGTWLIRVPIFCITFRIKQFPHLLLSTEIYVCVYLRVHKNVASNAKTFAPPPRFYEGRDLRILPRFTLHSNKFYWLIISLWKSLHLHCLRCHVFLKTFVWLSRIAHIRYTNPRTLEAHTVHHSYAMHDTTTTTTPRYRAVEQSSDWLTCSLKHANI